MKQIKLSLLFLLVCAASLSAQPRRYFDRVFNDVTVQTDITYSVNATVLLLAQFGQAVPQPLKMDVYSPAGDTETNRPLVVMMHTGNFLPPQVNGGCSGTIKDADNVAMARRLAQMGYVVAVADYRLGWNPVASTQTERVYTLINAVYRGIQDSRTCARFFRKSHANGNPYGIDPDKLIMWGIGTGGYISFATATLDTITDAYVPKFLTPQGPMVLEFLSGDVDGTKVGVNPGVPGLPFPAGDTLNYPNHVGFNSRFNLCVNLGGALGDLSWIDPGDSPMISFHNPTDPFAPCGTGIVLVPPPVNLPVVEVTGSCGAQPVFNAEGINNVFINANFQDALSVKARSINGNIEGYYPFLGNDSSPWAFSSSLSPYGVAGTNCDTASVAAGIYIDTVMTYFAPRACAVLGLASDCQVVSVKQLDQVEVGMTARPNPAVTDITLQTDSAFPMLHIELVDVAGRLVRTYYEVNNNQYTIPRAGLDAGMYFARVTFKEGVVTQKIMLR